MSKIKITCDSTCDLSRELYEKYDVEVIPLYITMGNDQYRDSVDISLPQLFDYVGEYHQLPKTAAVPVQDYIDRFQPYLDQGYSIIHINISSHMSSCHQNAKLAAQELKHVYPIDSLNPVSYTHLKLASTGGFLKAGNTTFICATEDDQVDAVISIIRDTCKTRKQLLFTPDSYGNGMPNPMPIEVEVGGATIFVTNIEHMEKV